MASWKRNRVHNLPSLRTAKVTESDTKCPKCDEKETLNSYSHFASSWDIGMIFGTIYFNVCTSCDNSRYSHASPNLQEYWDKKDAMSDLDEAKSFAQVYREKHFEWLRLGNKSQSFLLSDSVGLMRYLIAYTEELETLLKDNNISLPD